MLLSGSWGYIEKISKSRLAHNKTKRHVSDYGTQIETMGAAGEIIARRFLGLKEVLHDGFDGGADIRFSGWTVDVKATHLTPRVEYRYLQWPVGKPVKADIILMTAIDMDKHCGTVLGWVWGSEIKNFPVNKTRKYPCHEVPVRQLRPAWELMMMSKGKHD